MRCSVVLRRILEKGSDGRSQYPSLKGGRSSASLLAAVRPGGFEPPTCGFAAGLRTQLMRFDWSSTLPVDEGKTRPSMSSSRSQPSFDSRGLKSLDLCRRIGHANRGLGHLRLLSSLAKRGRMRDDPMAPAEEDG